MDSEDTLSQKMHELDDVSDRLDKLQKASKELRVRKTELQDWIKDSLEKKAKEDHVDKVQAVLGNSVYTVTRKKKYKNKAPTQKQIPSLLERYFSDVAFDPQGFLTMTPQQKAQHIHEHIWGNRGFSEKTAITRKKGNV